MRGYVKVCEEMSPPHTLALAQPALHWDHLKKNLAQNKVDSWHNTVEIWILRIRDLKF